MNSYVNDALTKVIQSSLMTSETFQLNDLSSQLDAFRNLMQGM